MSSIKCLVLISLCFNALLAAEFINPCPDILSFRQKRCGIEGIMEIPNDYSGDYTLIVNATWPGVGSDVKKLSIGIENYDKVNNVILSHIIYSVSYPDCENFPKITEATFNGNVVCSGPGHKVTRQGITNLSVVSKMMSSKQKEGASKYPNIINKPSASAIATKPPTLDDKTVFAQPSTCGVVNKIDHFIINGVEAKEGEFPWMAAIYEYNFRKEQYHFLCTSNLITNRHIITAAHCAVLEKEDFTIVLGKASLINWAAGATVAQVRKVYKHPNYVKHKSGNDIAIFALTEEISISNKIRPICLWRWGHSTDWLIKNGGTAAGWGIADDEASYSYKLNKIKMNVVSQATCNDRINLQNIISEKTFCGVANRKNAGPCSGDSGGGFFVENAGKFYLRGIVSAGDKNCNGDEFTVFADLYMHRDWINGIIS